MQELFNLIVHQVLMCKMFTCSHVHATNAQYFGRGIGASQHDYAIACCHTIILCSNLIRSLGKAGEIEGETEAILLENNIDFADFSKEITDSLPQLPWSIPKVANPDIHKIYHTLSLVSIFYQEEEEKRRDFRQECVFTIDPDTARVSNESYCNDCMQMYHIPLQDLDDALHVKQLREGTVLYRLYILC